MKVFCAQIVDEPENAPTLLLALTEAELLAKLKAHSDLAFLKDEGLQDCTTLDDVAELYGDIHEDMYAGIYYEEQDL